MYFVALKPNIDHSRKGLPIFISYRLMEEINEKKPFDPIYKTDWLLYHPIKHGIPPKEEYKLPKKLIMICELSKLVLDFFPLFTYRWLVSESFLNFLVENELLPENRVEVAVITELLSRRKMQPISEKKYYIIRWFRPFNDLLDIEKTQTDIVKHSEGKGWREHVYYKKIFFKDNVCPNLFFLHQPFYYDCFFVTQEIRDKMESKKFLGFDFYTLEEFMIKKEGIGFNDRNISR